MHRAGPPSSGHLMSVGQGCHLRREGQQLFANVRIVYQGRGDLLDKQCCLAEGTHGSAEPEQKTFRTRSFQHCEHVTPSVATRRMNTHVQVCVKTPLTRPQDPNG